jgi:hypothetical protein
MPDVIHRGRASFQVQSRSEEKIWHEVHLDEFRVNGSCTCDHFKFQMRPKLEAGYDPREHLRCHHINRAFQWMGQHAVMLAVSQSKPAIKFATSPKKDTESPRFGGQREYILRR